MFYFSVEKNTRYSFKKLGKKIKFHFKKLDRSNCFLSIINKHTHTHPLNRCYYYSYVYNVLHILIKSTCCDLSICEFGKGIIKNLSRPMRTCPHIPPVNITPPLKWQVNSRGAALGLATRVTPTDHHPSIGPVL